MRKKRILVTGSNGFIGSKLVPRLESDGRFEVFCFDHKTHGDIQIPGNLDKMKDKDIDHVIHLAAIANVLRCWDETSEVMHVNIMGTQNVLEFCRHNKANITMASTYLYGNPSLFPISEKADLKPMNPYAVSKKIGEDLCAYYHELFGVKSCILRMFNIYGPGQTTNFVIPVVLEQILEKRNTGEDVEVRALDSKRDYVYMDDLIEAFVSSIGYLEQDEQPESIFNIASGASYSVRELFEIARELLNADIGIFSNQKSRPNEVMDTRADVSRAADLLDWKPKTTFREGLKKVLETSYNIKF